MSLKSGSIGAGQGHINKVVPGVEVPEGGGHVDGEVIPLEAVLLSAAHDAKWPKLCFTLLKKKYY